MAEIIFDRSRHEAYEKCPRLRFLAYELPVSLGYSPAADDSGSGEEIVAHGIQRREAAVPLLSGGMVHKIAEFFVNGYGEDAAINNGLEAYDATVVERGIEVDELAPEPQWVIKVQRALIEALGRGWIRYVYPTIERDYSIISLEQETRAPFEYEGDHFILLARADMVLQRKKDERILVRNLKTINEPSARKLAAFRYDTQTISEVLASEHAQQSEVDGVIYDLLVKGKRKVEYPKGSGVWHNNSPLIWCYVKEGQSGITEDEIAAKWEYECKAPHGSGKRACPGGKNHKLSPQWRRTLVTEVFPNGILDWFQWLEDNEPGFIKEQFHTLDPIMRSPFDIETWMRSVLSEEKMIATKAQMVRDVMADGSDVRPIAGDLQSILPILDQTFPKHTAHGNCLWPSQCPMFNICWGTAAVDPMADGYMPRTPNHPEEIVVEEG